MHSLTISTTLLLAAASIIAPAFSQDQPFCTIQAATPAEQASKFKDFVQLLYRDENPSDAFHKYVKADYIQHSPEAPGGAGAQETVELLEQVQPTFDETVYHEGFDGGFGWVHTRLVGGPIAPVETALFDVYRWDGSCIVEHWDALQQRPNDTTNPLAMF